MKKVLPATILISIILIIISMPLLFLFDLQSFFLTQMDPDSSDLMQFQIGWLAFIVLAVDIFLPVPSSGVMTFCGAWFGDDPLQTWPAIMICFAGMTVSVAIGYWCSRLLGRRFVLRWSNESDLVQVENWLEQYGIAFLILLRGIPILSEASVLVSGAYRMNYIKVFIATSIANLVFAITYVLFGHYAHQSAWLPTAIIISLILPLFGLFLIRRKKRHEAQA